MRIGYAAKYPSALASSRFRVEIPSRHIKYPVGYGVGDITICPKHAVTVEEALKFRDKTILVWDVTDDHFSNPDEATYYREMPKAVHYVTCTTETLRDRIYENTGVEATVITDPLEFPTKPPRVGTEKFLWYGHHTNIRAIADIANKVPGILRVISNLDRPGIIPYSPENMKAGLEWCDAVLIPVKKEGYPTWDCKSPNRMTEAINAGRFVIANPMPAYEGYDMWTGDILEGINWFRQQQHEALQRLSIQKEVWEKHSPQAVAKQWETLFDSIWAAERKYGRVTST